jgi:hypothetical protein
MKVSLDIELSREDYARIQHQMGVPFLSAAALKSELQARVRAALAAEPTLETAIGLGWLFAVKYYRPAPAEPHGYSLHEHIFMGKLWPHVAGRPALVAPDQRTLSTVGGDFRVSASGVIFDTPPA